MRYILIYSILLLIIIPSVNAVNNLSVDSITNSSVTIRWDTYIAGTSQIEYGLDTSYGYNSSTDPLAYFHVTPINGLLNGTTYHYRIVSYDYNGTKSTTSDYNFTTRTNLEYENIIKAARSDGLLAKIYYVKPSGNDGNDGLTIDTAWQTVDHAFSTVDVGDTVYILPGTYSETITLYSSGIDSAPIVFRTYNSSKPYVSVITIESNYVTFDSINTNTFSLDGSNNTLLNSDAINAEISMGDSHYNTIENCTIHDSVFNGIQFIAHGVPYGDSGPPSTHLAVINTSVNRTPDHGGLDFYGQYEYLTLRNNELIDNAGAAAYGHDYPDYRRFVVFDGNYVHDQPWNGFFLGIFSDMLILNNTFENITANAPLVVYYSSARVFMRNNSFYDSFSPCLGDTGPASYDLLFDRNYIHNDTGMLFVRYDSTAIVRNPLGETDIYLSGNVTLEYDNNTVFVVPGYQVTYYSNRSTSPKIYLVDEYVTHTTYPVSVRPNTDYVFVNVNSISESSDYYNITVNSSTLENPTWINVTVQNASSNYNITRDEVYYDQVTSGSDNVARYYYSVAGNEWSNHSFNITYSGDYDEQNYIPPVPISLVNTTYNFGVNHTWQAGTGNVTNSYNISQNGTWTNDSTALFLNASIGAHNWSNISVYAYNSSGTGSLNSTPISMNTQVPNNAISISNISSSYSITEGQILYIDANHADSDGDVGTFADNATQWNVNTSTGIVSWITIIGDNGTYSWQINVSDGYGSMSFYEFNVTVDIYSDVSYVPPVPVNLSYVSNNLSYINWSWQAPSDILFSNYTSYDNWTEEPNLFYWSIFDCTSNISSNTTDYIFGNKSLKLVSTSSSAKGVKYTLVSPINLNDYDSFVFWIKTNKTVSWRSTYSTYLDIAGNNRWDLTGQNITSTWTEYRLNKSDMDAGDFNSISAIHWDWFVDQHPIEILIDNVHFERNEVLYNKTDSYNISINGTWDNTSSQTYKNVSIGIHNWSNVSVYAYNGSGNGSLSINNINSSILLNQQPVLSSIGNKHVYVNDTLSFTLSGTDGDNDTVTYTTNATKGVYNNTSKQFSWTPNVSEVGIYSISFSANDSYGGIYYENISIDVSSEYPTTEYSEDFADWMAMPQELADVPCVLDSGNVTIFCLGGYQGIGVPTNVSYKYYIGNDTFVQLPNMLFASWGHAAIIYNQDIYLFGGSPNSTGVQRYNIPSNSWYYEDPITIPGGQGIHAVLDTNLSEVYLFGGSVGSTAAAKLNLTTHGYSSINNTLDIFNWATANYYQNKIYALGGAFGTNAKNITRIYNISNNTWYNGSPMPVSIYGHTREQSIYGDCIYYSHGQDTNGYFYSTLYKYNISTDTHFNLSPALFHRDGIGSVIYQDMYYAFGGRLGTALDRANSVFETYNITSNTWKYISNAKNYISFPYNASSTIVYDDATIEFRRNLSSGIDITKSSHGASKWVYDNTDTGNQFIIPVNLSTLGSENYEISWHEIILNNTNILNMGQTGIALTNSTGNIIVFAHIGDWIPTASENKAYATIENGSDYSVNIPSSADEFKIRVLNNTSINILFDNISLIQYNSSMNITNASIVSTSYSLDSPVPVVNIHNLVIRTTDEVLPTWWNSSWQYRLDNYISNGVRPYQLSLNISNATGTNNATHIYCNGNCSTNFSDIRFTLDNQTELSYWIEEASFTKVWVNVTANGTVNMYYGNPSTTTNASIANTFPFGDDFTSFSHSQSVSTGTATIAAWGSIFRLNSTHYFRSVRTGSSHILNGSIAKTVYNISTGTWSGYTTIYNSSYDDRNTVSGLINGSVFVFFARCNDPCTLGTDFQDIGFVSSSDGGNVWGSYNPVFVKGLNNISFSPYGHIEQMNASTYIVPIYGTDNGTSTQWLRLLRTSDAGNTWNLTPFLSNAANSLSELEVVHIGNNKLIAHIRTDGGSPYIKQSISSDAGETWSSVVDTNLGVNTYTKFLSSYYDSSDNTVVSFFCEDISKICYYSKTNATIVFGSATSYTTPASLWTLSGYIGNPSITKYISNNYIVSYGTGVTSDNIQDYSNVHPATWTKMNGSLPSHPEGVITVDNSWIWHNTQTFGQNYSFVLRLKPSSTSVRQNFCFSNQTIMGASIDCANSIYAYAAGYLHNAPAYYIQNRETAQTQVSSGTYPTSYSIYEIIRNGSTNVHYLRNGTDVTNSPITTNIPSTAGYIHLLDYANTTGSVEYDWIFVRSYRYPEPIWDVWTAAYSYSTPGNLTLYVINASVNAGEDCAVEYIIYRNLSTGTEYTFICGQSGNASITVNAGEAVWMYANSNVSKIREW